MPNDLLELAKILGRLKPEPTPASKLFSTLGNAPQEEPYDVKSGLGEGPFIDQTPAVPAMGGPSGNMADSLRARSGDDMTDNRPQGMAESLRVRSGDDMMAPPAPAPAPRRSLASKKTEAKETAKPVDYKAPEHDSSERLKEAQGKAGLNELNAQLTGAGQTVNEAFSRAKFNRDGIESLHKNANRPVDEYNQQEAGTKSDLDIVKKMYDQATTAKMADPNSDLSVATRNLFKQMGINLAPNVSALDMQNSGQLDKLIGIKERSKDRALQLKMHEDQMKEAQLARESLQQKKLDDLSHQRNIRLVKTDSVMKEDMERSSRLNSALQRIETTGKVMPQDLMDLEALYISNAGIKGNSTGAERAERFAKNLGINAAELEQMYLSDGPVDIGHNNPLLNHFQGLVKKEVNFFKDRFGKRLDATAAGNHKMYERNPELAEELEQLKQTQLAQLPSFEEDKKSKSASAPSRGPALAPNEVKRVTADGKTAIFDGSTKQFLRYE